MDWGVQLGLTALGAFHAVHAQIARIEIGRLVEIACSIGSEIRYLSGGGSTGFVFVGFGFMRGDQEQRTLPRTKREHADVLLTPPENHV